MKNRAQNNYFLKLKETGTDGEMYNDHHYYVSELPIDKVIPFTIEAYEQSLDFNVDFIELIKIERVELMAKI